MEYKVTFWFDFPTDLAMLIKMSIDAPTGPAKRASGHGSGVPAQTSTEEVDPHITIHHRTSIYSPSYSYAPNLIIEASAIDLHRLAPESARGTWTGGRQPWQPYSTVQVTPTY